MRRPVDEEPAPARIAFRRMREEDLSRVSEIERSGFAHPWSEDLLRRELAHAWSVTLVAADSEADAAGREVLLGFIVFWLVHDEVHVLNIAVAEEARRRGIGRALMLEAADEGRRRGARLATLEVRRSNYPAIELYRTLGYRQIGIRPNYYADEGEDAIVMLADL
jgi:ribosomal-protein-alanine N-acetyltransferase